MRYEAEPQDYDLSAPSALVIAEDGDAHAALDALALAGCRARAPIGFGEAAQALSGYGAVDLILIEAAGVPETLLDVVLARADTVARERSLGIVATVAPEQIDAAAALLLAPRTQLLCAPSNSERVSAVAAAKWLARGEVNDVSREGEILPLQRLHEEVARLADTLARLTREEAKQQPAGVRGPVHGYRGPEDGETAAIDAPQVRAVIRARRMRAQFFGPELFADPAWDMLLDLFAAGIERRRVSVSSLCIAAAVPPTTALRWIGTLNEAGLFERQADPSDRRRAYIGLSAKAVEGMKSYAGAVQRAGLPLV
ncbi:winged helix DNA-binding protein [Sphingomonas sp. IC-56]|uniref:winged helix DNA-binding protein n=1 Tax=Sphingomonas sp. IC-56 TaxID=2898529 RepID=UPI001E3F8FBB|nr:winged helix DNA-binding protein [Sphingomonas sp. IC-56]MCD2323374.1 winged helix DNA-binding protein [Sphingomonas sp. IC-56]